MTHPTPRTAPPTDALPAAVLWDMDGTLVDTEPAWIEAEFALIEEHGGTWSREHALQLVGNDLIESGRYIHAHAGIDLAPEQIVHELLDRVVRTVSADVPWRPGAPELLAALRAAGVPTALVTMSYRRFADPVVAALPEDSFDAVVVGDEVAHGKPHPEPYLAAARALGLDPAVCVAIEDSPTGARSAAAAGCRTICVPHHVPVPEGDWTLHETLVDLTPEDLLPLTAARVTPGVSS